MNPTPWWKLLVPGSKEMLENPEKAGLSLEQVVEQEQEMGHV